MLLELTRGLGYLIVAAVLVPLATQRLGSHHRLRQIVIGIILAAGGSASMFDPSWSSPEFCSISATSPPPSRDRSAGRSARL